MNAHCCVPPTCGVVQSVAVHTPNAHYPAASYGHGMPHLLFRPCPHRVPPPPPSPSPPKSPAGCHESDPDWGRCQNRDPRPSKYGGTWHKCGRDGLRWGNLIVHSFPRRPSMQGSEMMSCHAGVHIVVSMKSDQKMSGSLSLSLSVSLSPEPRPSSPCGSPGRGGQLEREVQSTLYTRPDPGTYRCNDWRDRNGPGPCPLEDVTQRNGQCLVSAVPSQRPHFLTTVTNNKKRACGFWTSSCPTGDTHAHTPLHGTPRRREHTSTQHQTQHLAAIT